MLGKKSLDFRAHIRVAVDLATFEKLSNPGVPGFVEKNEAQLAFQVFSEKINVPVSGDFVLTWCL